MIEKKNPFCTLILITTPKLAGKAVKMFQKSSVPVQYEWNAVGTASSEMIDVLGLGTPDKQVLISILPKEPVDEMLIKLKKILKLGTINSGIAFTLSLSGASSLVVKMLGQMEQGETRQEEMKQAGRGDRIRMSETGYSLIAAVVNQGYSENVMEAARTAGAGGGTVVPGRFIGKEQSVGFFGMSLQDEKDMVFIVAENGNKLKIMQTIGEKCGMHSEAKGIVVSLPIDNVIGFEDVD